MEILLLILVSILMGAFNVGFFLLGYYVRSKKPIETKETIVGKDAGDAIKDVTKWLNYNGLLKKGDN